MFAYLQQLQESLWAPPDFFPGVGYTITAADTEMPSQSSSIRRCAFKLPKNDRYQCQKAGDKYQLNIHRWYCRFHDRFAKDRCQTLIERAGKGAQCDQLGTLDEQTGQRLCKWHSWKSKGDDGSQHQGATPKKRKDTMTTIEPNEAENVEQDTAKQERTASRSTLPCLPRADGPVHTSVPEGSVEQPVRASSIGGTPMCISCQSQISTATPKGVIAAEDEKLQASPEIFEDSPAATLVLGVHIAEEHRVSTPTTSLEELNELTATNTKALNGPHSGGRSPHTRVDSLDPLTASSLIDEGSNIFSPTSTAQAAYKEVVQSLSSTGVLQSVPPPRRALQARIDFLNAQEASSSARNAAIYVRCCVCLEKHGEYNMRQVDACQHQYRDLCLRKATKVGNLRKFNCTSCSVWMEERQKEMIESGYHELRRVSLR